MKVLLQNPFISGGGAEVRQKLLVESLIKRSDIEEVHFMFVGAESLHDVQGGGKIHVWQIRKANVERLTRKVIEDHEIDVFQLHNNQLVGVRGLRAAQEMGLPTVWVMHDAWPCCWQRFMIPVWQAMDHELCYKINPRKCRKCVGDYYYSLAKRQREIVNKCDAGIVPSKRWAEIFEDNDLLVGKWKIVKPWINLELFKPDPKIKRNPWQVMFAGNFIPHKGIQVLLKAWDLVYRRLPMARLVAQGDQRSLNPTMELAKKLRLQNLQLLRTMPQEELKRIYNESSILVFPTIWNETAGLIWIEALAMGTPVICSRIGSIPELLKYGGELFEPRNHVELAEKIVGLLLSPTRRNKLANEGYKYVRENFKPERAADDFTKMYYLMEVGR